MTAFEVSVSKPLCLEMFPPFCFTNRTQKNLFDRFLYKVCQLLWFLFQGKQIVCFLRNQAFCRKLACSEKNFETYGLLITGF